MAAWPDGKRKMGDLDIRVIVVIRERSKGKGGEGKKKKRNLGEEFPASSPSVGMGVRMEWEIGIGTEGSFISFWKTMFSFISMYDLWEGGGKLFSRERQSIPLLLLLPTVPILLLSLSLSLQTIPLREEKYAYQYYQYWY
jgi:hypothetical protein